MRGAFGVAFAIVQTRVDPVHLTEYAVIASAVAMPLAWVYFAIICAIAVAGPVLMVRTHQGELR